MSTLRDLYYGRINPDKEVCDSSTYDVAVKDFRFNVEMLRNYVPRDCHEQIDNLYRMAKVIEHEHGLMMFRAGFSLAMKISAESYIDGGKNSMVCPLTEEN